QDAEAPAVTTATIKRSDLLQAELSSHPTTITERILSDLHAHDDNPVDRALAELLSKQLNGEYQHGPPHSGAPPHEYSDAGSTDVIMPGTDGYSVCTQVKQHAQFGHIPVVLMSGVVNKTVADKAVAVKADELIRKPFQPQELIGRVKSLLTPKSAAPAAHERP